MVAQYRRFISGSLLREEFYLNDMANGDMRDEVADEVHWGEVFFTQQPLTCNRIAIMAATSSRWRSVGGMPTAISKLAFKSSSHYKVISAAIRCNFARRD